jgi:PKD repeat protein
MKKIFTLLCAILLINSSQAQTWQTVGTNSLGNDIHGFAIWNNLLALGGSFNNNPCDKIALFDSTNYTCPAGGIGTVVRAVTSWNGNLVAVGDFWNNSQPCTDCNGVAMWNGTSWTNLGTGFNNDVLCLTVWNGNLVAGGDFTTADGNTCYRVAMWNGTNWAAIGGQDTAFDNDVRALAVYNGQLWVGGDFSNVNGCTACDRIVKWDGNAWVGGNSGVDIPGGLDSTVRVLYVDQAANLLYMGGHFLEVGGNTNASGVAVYNGNAWSAMGTGVNSYVRAITKYNGNIIVGGDFSTAGGNPASRVAKWSPTTSTWSTMGSGFNDYLRALIPYKGHLYAGGSFTQSGSASINFIAKWYEAPTVPPVAMFTPSATSACAGQCLSFTDNSQNSPTSWSWSFPGATPSSSTAQNPTNICYNSPGTYAVVLTVTNANGSNTATQAITISSTPAPNAGADVSLCAGSATTLNATGATSYTWGPATGLSATTGSSVTAAPGVTTTYTLTASNGACSASDTIKVTVNPLPTIAAAGSDTVCAGTSVPLAATGTNSFVWQPGPMTGFTVVVTPAVTTTYTVVGTDQNGCSDTAFVTVTVNPSPVVTASATSSCSGSQATLTAAGNAVSYSWMPGSMTGTTITVTPTSTTTYTVTGTGANGCTSTATATVNVGNAVNIAATGPSTVCSNASATLAVTGAATYTWMPGSMTGSVVTVSPTTNTTYTVIGTDANGCSDTTTVSISVLTAPTVTAGSPGTICVGETTVLAATGGSTYTWSPSTGLSCTNCQAPVASPTVTTAYTVTATAANGCSASANTVVFVNPCTGIDESSANGIHVYPNPLAGSELTVEIPLQMLSSSSEFMLVDVTGRLVMKAAISSEKMKISRSTIQSGIYFWMISSSEGLSGKGKIVVE